MAHLALYRQLRPRDFSAVIGQEHIIRILKNQLQAGTAGHAYLFCGTRGTGKTSMAKIFANALNCKNLNDNGPCGLCPSCLAALENRNLNIIEIDAASNNGVDNVREIREEVKYPPSDGGVKVYIIDEVHMLSTGAFNALLKTLEEPPPRVVFILATTDVARLPATILSRCIRLDFKRISLDEMSAALSKYTEDLAITIDMEALRYICSVSDGAMRDALSLLDQCISYYPGEIINAKKIMAITGAVDNTVFFDFMVALACFDSNKCLEIIAEIIDMGKDVGRFISDFVEHLRNLMVVSATKTAVADMPDFVREKYKEQSEIIDISRLMSYIHEFSALSASLRYSFSERVMLECLCIKLCNPQIGETTDLAALVTRIERLESVPFNPLSNNEREISKDNGITVKKAENTDKAKESAYSSKSVSDEHVSIPEVIEPLLADWEVFIKNFEAPINIFLTGTNVKYMGDGLCIMFPDNSWISHVNERKEIISQAISEKYALDLPLVFVSDIEENKNDIENNFAKKPLPDKLAGIDIEWE